VVGQVLQKLASEFLYFDLPLAPDARQAFGQTAQLTAEMALGYKVAITDSILNTKPPYTINSANEKLNRHQRHRALAQCLHYLTVAALRHTQVFLDWPTDTWRDANALMWLAKHEKLDRRSITLGDQVTSVQSLYARLCLMGIVNSNKFTPQTFQRVYNTLGSMTAQIQFTPQPNPHLGDNQIYSVGSHGQPQLDEFKNNSNDNRRLYFTAGTILRNLELPTSTSETSSTEAAFNGKRQHPRTATESLVTAEIGFKDIMSAMQITNPEDINNHSQTALTDNENQLPNVLTSNEYGVDFQFENVSKNGFSVKTMAAAYSRLKVGELFANRYFNEAGNALWHVAVIRWIKSETSKSGNFAANFGIETLTGNAVPVVIDQRYKGKQTTQSSIEGLIANCHGNDITTKILILPKQKLKTGETITYSGCDGQHLVKLFVSLEESHSFQCFALKPIEDKAAQKLQPATLAVS